GILNYIPQFRGETFVLAAEGEVLASGQQRTLLQDIAVMHSLNMKVILVHGAGKQMLEAASEAEIEISNHDGTGRTDATTLDLSVQTISRINLELIHRLQTVGLKGVSGSFVEADAAGVKGGEELEHTGRVSQIDQPLLESLLSNDLIPLVSPLARDSKGRMYRMNSDQIAAQIAVAVGACKLIFLGSRPIAEMLQTKQREFTVDAALAQSENLDHLNKARMKEGAKACRNGVPRVHFLNGMDDSALLRELFDNDGIGAMIYADVYRKIRPMEKSDVAVLISMMRDSIDDEAVLNRTTDSVLNDLERFSVLVVDGNLVGAAALYPDAESSTAEIASLFVQSGHRKKGYGARLIEHLEGRARELGCGKVYALTTQAAGFFSSEPYQQGELKDLPKGRQEKAKASGRNSYVFYRDL
ncbi:MAG: amino-acid N-acetyltransferase, partial [Verrucomicrobiota bacterium]